MTGYETDILVIPTSTYILTQVRENMVSIHVENLNTVETRSSIFNQRHKIIQVSPSTTHTARNLSSV
jgi:hypothetical protein